MRCTDYDYFGSVPESEILRRKRPAVFILETIITEGAQHNIRVGCGWHDKPLPAFSIPFTIPYGDFIMVSNPDILHPSKCMPSSIPPNTSSHAQREMAFQH